MEFFSQVNSKNGISYVVLLHSSRDRKSQLRDILSRYVKLEVVDIKQDLEVKPNKVYIAPPSNYVGLKAGKFQLTPRDPSELINRTIDHFFRSLSEEVGDKAIAIVLSGIGRDGTIGFEAVETNNGTTITQSPETAQFDGMPINTLLFRNPKHVLPPKEMHSVIKNLVVNKHKIVQRFKA